VKLYIRK